MTIDRRWYSKPIHNKSKKDNELSVEEAINIVDSQDETVDLILDDEFSEEEIKVMSVAFSVLPLKENDIATESDIEKLSDSMEKLKESDSSLELVLGAISGEIDIVEEETIEVSEDFLEKIDLYNASKLVLDFYKEHLVSKQGVELYINLIDEFL